MTALQFVTLAAIAEAVVIAALAALLARPRRAPRDLFCGSELTAPGTFQVSSVIDLARAEPRFTS